MEITTDQNKSGSLSRGVICPLLKDCPFWIRGVLCPVFLEFRKILFKNDQFLLRKKMNFHKFSPVAPVGTVGTQYGR